jgi:hypothetical protein
MSLLRVSLVRLTGSGNLTIRLATSYTDSSLLTSQVKCNFLLRQSASDLVE